MQAVFNALGPAWSAIEFAFPALGILFLAHAAFALVLLPGRLLGLGPGSLPWRYLGLISGGIDAFNRSVGKLVAWSAFAMVVIQFAIVVVSYVFSAGSIWYQESVIYLHAALFLLAAAYTLQEDGHVRVDVFFRGASKQRQAMTDLLGHILFLLPVMALILYVSYPYVQRAWAVFEGSKETSGIQAVYLLKSLIIAFAVMLALQGLSGIIKSVHRLIGGDGWAAPDAPTSGHVL